MRIIQTLAFEAGEDHIVKKFNLLEAWTGVREREETDPLRKSFRRISGNAPSLDDVHAVLKGSLEIADSLAEQAETVPCPFPEIPGRTTSVEEDWRNGLRAQPGRIRREVDSLVDLLQDATGLDFTTPASEPAPSPSI